MFNICTNLVLVFGSLKHDQFRTYLLDIDEKDAQNKELQGQLTVATGLNANLKDNITLLMQEIATLKQKNDVQANDIQHLNNTINVRK